MKKFVELLVAEFPDEVAIDQHDAVVHVLQHGAHVLACRLDLGARRGKITLALLHSGDVAGGSDHADRISVGSALGDAALARPSPRVVVGQVAVLDEQPRCGALEVIGDRRAVLLEIVKMDAGTGLRRCQRHVFRHAENRAQQRRVIDGAFDNVPVVDALIDGLQSAGIALLVRRRTRMRRLSARLGAVPHFRLSGRLCGPCFGLF